ncbi:MULTISPECIES: hypothetical protein [unclassified Wolbachia]|nr:hypothetical protein [Wolbachia endosymbiont (group A) of Apoderus coryli]
MNFVSSHQIFSVAMQQSPLGSILLFFWIPASRAGMTKAANFSCK